MMCKCGHEKQCHKESKECMLSFCDCKQFNREFHNTTSQSGGE